MEERNNYTNTVRIEEAFKKVKNNKFLWPNSLKERNRINLFMSLYIHFWIKVQTLLIHRWKVKKPITRVKTFWGDNMSMIFPHPSFLYFFGVWGRNEIFLADFIIKNLKTSDTFIDGGANIGYFSLLAANLIGERGSVHSFEPTPSVYSVLSDNSSKYNNIIVNQKALYNVNSYSEFTDFGLKYSLYNSIYDKDDLPDHHLAKRESLDIKKIKVESVCLDTYCTLNNVQPNFIKLDTEGVELNVILGSINTLSVYRPILAIEIWEFMINNGDFEKIHTLLSDLSYDCYQLTQEFNLNKISTGNQVFDYNYFNIVFVPK